MFDPRSAEVKKQFQPEIIRLALYFSDLMTSYSNLHITNSAGGLRADIAA